jgi:uncharacterized protein YcnI
MKRSSIIVASGAALLLALAAPAAAFAHVTVAPNTAPAGSYTLINFKVPNESATAVTNKVELALPTDTPILHVSYVPVAGWTTELMRETLPNPVTVGDNTITEAITTVVWTASPGHEISDGQLQVFPLSVGPVPDTGSIVFTADQTYSDGSVVSWADTTAGAAHPAPVLFVNDAPASDRSATAAPDTIARGLGIGGLTLGAVGMVFAVVALRRKST